MRVKYSEGIWQADLNIRAATQLDGTRRAIWQSRAAKVVTTDQVESYMRFIQHPDLCAPLAPDSVLIVDGEPINLPIEYDVFASLPDIPDGLFTPWFDAVYLLNPSWREKDDAEKKDEGQTSRTDTTSA